ncbi:MAG: AAA family ATPase [Chloroflexota bacterium]|nr:AAA family ATPase [Chloroflexota bacterium]
MKISVHLKNCYGIRALRHEFDFTNGKALLLYAPNGAMKTSLARVFKDISVGQDPRDAIFPDRPSECSVDNDFGMPSDEEHIFVVTPYEDEEIFSSTRMATLLVNEELKRRYESIRASIDEAKTALLASVARTAGIRSGVEEELLTAFGAGPSDVYSLLEGFEAEVNSNPTYDFSGIAYQEIFNQRVQAFLARPGITTLLREYVAKYDELIENSLYFRKGVFNHNNASTVSRTLKQNGFFEAKHLVSLLDTSSERKEVSNQEEFDAVIVQEKNRIFNDPELSKRFEAIDKEITKNVELRSLRSYLDGHRGLVPELADLDGLRRKVWASYLISNEDRYGQFLDVFMKGKEELAGIIDRAKQQATLWHNVVRIFNERFSVPFVLEVANQDDVILKDQSPSLLFKYQDGTDQCEVGRDDLLNVLSTGEKRALYILNVIFELEARAKSPDRTLVLLDDIADSFDYKNKYAIISYLKDNLESGRFLFIILTHNFDFFRTVQRRLNIDREHNCLMSLKTDRGVDLVKAQYLHPFEYWKSNLHRNQTMLVAAIPMVRNIIEYTEGQDCASYSKLTSLLHQKSDSATITLAELADIINGTLSLDLSLGPGEVLPLIFEQAKECLNAPECINLENKVVLSIAIRLAAEEVMIRRINDPAQTDNLGRNQTLKLFNTYKQRFPSDTSEVRLLDRVVMMTPEPIHLNSFMYEPLIDLSDYHLKDLYRSVDALLKSMAGLSVSSAPES